MYRNLAISFLTFVFIANLVNGKETEGNFIKDVRTGCIVWFKHNFSEDSVTWTGACKDGFAHGKGTMIGFTQGKQSSKYIGEMQKGKPWGKGTFTFAEDRKLEGNFINGEPLFLKKELLLNLSKHIISETDSTDAYVGDNNQKQLYYNILLPPSTIQGVIVLMPGTWETTEHLLSSMSSFCELAYKNNLAVLVLSINQRLTLTDLSIQLMNNMFADAIKKYNLPKEKFVLGGWSMGGIFSIRYTELANQDSSRTTIKPIAVFSCDGPCDLINIYNNFKRKFNKYPGQIEPAYGIREMEKHCGGTPTTAASKYMYFSPYSHGVEGGGNAKYLINTPVRIYGDVDPLWWMQNRHVDMYDLNALDQTAMIQLLNDLGNRKAEFINAYQKGVRIEGNRHPHSWSIVEPADCIKWILKSLKNSN